MNANSVAYQPEAKLPKLVLRNLEGKLRNGKISGTALTAPYKPILI